MQSPSKTCGSCANQLEQILRSRIRVYQHLGGRVMSYDGDRLVMEAPLSLNSASCGSVFAGSVGSLLMICGFGLIYLKLKEIDCDARVMLGRCTLSHEREVRTEWQAFCELAPRIDSDRFQQTLLGRGMMNLRVRGGIECGAQTMVTFEGIYAVREVTDANKGSRHLSSARNDRDRRINRL